MDNIEALKIFKPTFSNRVLSAEQVRKKTELFIQTNDVPREKALANNKDISGILSFKEVITESTKINPRWLSLPSICIYIFLLLLLFATSSLLWIVTQAERDRKEKQWIAKEEAEVSNLVVNLVM